MELFDYLNRYDREERRWESRGSSILNAGRLRNLTFYGLGDDYPYRYPYRRNNQ